MIEHLVGLLAGDLKYNGMEIATYCAFSPLSRQYDRENVQNMLSGLRYFEHFIAGHLFKW